MTTPSVLQIIGGGLAGSSVTYALTWLRERRRTTDSYRAPQRDAIAGIIAATHEFLIAEADFREAAEEVVKEESGQPSRRFSDDQLDKFTREFQRTALGIDRAFQVGRLTIVEAVCYEQMGIAYNRFVQIKNVFKEAMTGQSAEAFSGVMCQMNMYATQLNRDVADLVLAAHKKVSPTQSMRDKAHRRAVRKRLEAEFSNHETLAA